MRATAQDLIDELGGRGGVPFQHFIYELVVAEARHCGVSIGRIRYDHRVNIGDGGRDIIVEARHRRRQRFLPQVPSIWSVKAGADGVEPATLRREIRDPGHTELQEHLKQGHKYVWCALQDLSQGDRDAMSEAARELAEERGFKPEQIEFRWNEALSAQLNEYPNLIAIHLPRLATQLRGLHALREWERVDSAGFAVPWVNFGGRTALAERITAHLLGREGPNVLHLAGFSGIGKTRTVLEACRIPTHQDKRGRDVQELLGVFYLPRFTDLSPEIWRYLEDEGRHVQLVIDEVPLADLDGLISRLAPLAERVRVVTIGPALRMDAGRRLSDPNVLLLPEPDTEAGVLAVARAAGEGLPEPVLRSIAEASAHDLRLALLLVRATRRSGEFHNAPVVDTDGIWRRLMSVFGAELGDTAHFRSHYEALTSCIDVGHAGHFAEELAYVADYFQIPLRDLERSVDVAGQCGLGNVTPSFFEAVPRALAAQVFQDWVWRRVRADLARFHGGMPERLQRRFLERCQECRGQVREEVQRILGDYFLAGLAGGDITQLSEREPSRLFQAWAEFDPGRGLVWLREAARHATPDQLASLDGYPDGSGGWRGRRQLVWLCQNLASFAEYFNDCEEILFRFAQTETEEGIGNNSTRVWQSLFEPRLAHTEVPFAERWPRLLDRLRAATPDTLPLILGAAFEGISPMPSGQPYPPRVVGGRVVPERWRPENPEQLHGLWLWAARQLLGVIRDLPEPVQEPALAGVVDQLGSFLRLGLLEEVRGLLAGERLTERLRRALLAAIDQWTAFDRELAERGEEPRGVTTELLSRWRADLAPPDLPTRVRDVTAQDYWAIERSSPGTPVYAELAADLLHQPGQLADLADWFDGQEVKSEGALGYALGRQDGGGVLAPVIEGWLAAGRCAGLVAEYLRGVANAAAGLPDRWVQQLDRLAGLQPAAVAQATLSADVSERGLQRLMRVLGDLPAPASRFLRPLAYRHWSDALGVGQRTELLEAIHTLMEAGDPWATSVGLQLVAVWYHEEGSALDPLLASPLLALVTGLLTHSGRVGGYEWELAVRRLGPHRPGEVAEVLATVLTTMSPWLRPLQDESVAALVELARTEPRLVMEAVGRCLLDPERRVFFGLLVCRGLFEAIGLPVVEAWVTGHGAENVRWIARHLASPYLGEHGHPVVPPLTRWVLEAHEDDDRAFQAFCAGRHSFEFRSAPQEGHEEVRRQLEPFLHHELRRVREWAEYELHDHDWRVSLHAQLDDESERT